MLYELDSNHLKDVLSGSACRVSSADEGAVTLTVDATDIAYIIAFAPRPDERHGFHEGMSGVELHLITL